MSEALHSPSAEEIEQVSRFFIGLGAEAKPAEVMARQLLKRAAQISVERKISYLEATQTLLKQVVQARQGGESPMDSDIKPN